MIILRNPLYEKITIKAIEKILNSINWVSEEKINNPIDDLVFRVMDKKEWNNVLNGLFSGAFWSSNPMDYGQFVIRDSNSLFAVSTASGFIQYMNKGPHYNNTDRKGIENIIAVFKWEGNRYSGKFKIVYGKEL